MIQIKKSACGTYSQLIVQKTTTTTLRKRTQTAITRTLECAQLCRFHLALKKSLILLCVFRKKCHTQHKFVVAKVKIIDSLENQTLK